MAPKIEAAVQIGLVWNDDANEWEVEPAWLTGDLHWVDDKSPYASILNPPSAEEFTRAEGHPVTAEELTQMLGFAMVRATAPANADVQHRPASSGLVHMLEDAIKETRPLTTAEERGRLIRALLPIISSVDENAHRRGVFEQRQAALAQPDRELIRAAINDAYYETRNEGGTMDAASARAADGVMALIGSRS